MISRFLILIMLLSSALFALHENKCSIHEKFIKSYEYISRLKNAELTRQEMAGYASDLSSKCHNTFDRFKDVYGITEKTDLSVKASIILSVRIAIDKEIKINKLKEIFEFLIAPTGPDLVFKKAMDLTEEFAKTGPDAIDHLKNVYGFCMENKEIPYTKLKCVDLALKIAKMGFEKKNLLVDAYNYFSTHKLINYNYKKSLEMSLKILNWGPNSFEDFKKVFEYSIKKTGVNLSRDLALKIALNAVEKAESKEDDKKKDEKK